MRNNKITIPIIAALVIAVISLGVAFAAFSAVLTINGNATIEASSWDIHFSETEKTSTAGSGAAPAQGGVTISPESEYLGTAESTLSTLTRDTFTWSGTFKTPGDTLEYHFWIVNAGDYNATLSAPTVNQPTCKISGVTQQSCPIIYSVSKDTNGTPFTGSDSLASGASQFVVVKAQLDPNYGGDGSELSNVDIDVSFYTVTFTYTQNGAAGQAQSGGGSSGGSGGSQAASVEYLIPYYSYMTYDEEGHDIDVNIDEHWGEKSELENIYEFIPTVYLKKVDNVVNNCFEVDSTEYCANASTTLSQFLQMCNSIPNTYVDGDYGSEGLEGAECVLRDSYENQIGELYYYDGEDDGQGNYYHGNLTRLYFVLDQANNLPYNCDYYTSGNSMECSYN